MGVTTENAENAEDAEEKRYGWHSRNKLPLPPMGECERRHRLGSQSLLIRVFRVFRVFRVLRGNLHRRF